jgi:hypothetical protein
MASTPPEFRPGAGSFHRERNAARTRAFEAPRRRREWWKARVVLPEIDQRDGSCRRARESRAGAAKHGLGRIGAEGCRRSFGEYQLLKDFCYKVKWQFKWQFGGIQAQEGRRGFPRAAFPAANTPGRAKPPSARLRKSHIFAAVAPVPTDRAGSGPAARVGRSYQEYPLIKDCCYKPKVFCMLICKPNIYIL